MDKLKKLEFIKTMKVYGYFMKSDSMFYELIETLETIGTSIDDTHTIITKLIKIIGGSTITVPTIEELLIFKWLLSDRVDTVKLMNNLNSKYIIKLISEEYGGTVPPEIDVLTLSKRLVKVLKHGKN